MNACSRCSAPSLAGLRSRWPRSASTALCPTRSHGVPAKSACGSRWARRAGVSFGWSSRQSLMLVIAGLVIGCAAAVYLARFVETLLFGVRPADPLIFVVAASVLGAVALFAAWLPARRAAAVDPVRDVRYE